jgi:hypothetical protein
MSSGLDAATGATHAEPRRAQQAVDLTSDVALEAAHDLGLGLALGQPARQIGPGGLMPA